MTIELLSRGHRDLLAEHGANGQLVELAAHALRRRGEGRAGRPVQMALKPAVAEFLTDLGDARGMPQSQGAPAGALARRAGDLLGAAQRVSLIPSMILT
ncbi:hypothetical protein [Nonomuraea jabiensis]|uniref:hypothetical protein n=1 Tax=Nonomuraea jabiensis TaxID=882448 RepID=UPI003D703C62